MHRTSSALGAGSQGRLPGRSGIVMMESWAVSCSVRPQELPRWGGQLFSMEKRGPWDWVEGSRETPQAGHRATSHLGMKALSWPHVVVTTCVIWKSPPIQAVPAVSLTLCSLGSSAWFISGTKSSWEQLGLFLFVSASHRYYTDKKSKAISLLFR